VYTSILHATDLNETHFHLCQQAMNVALKFNATFYLLHVIEQPTSLQLAQGLGFAEIDTPPADDATIVMRALGEALNIPVSHQFVEIGSIKTHTLRKIQTLNCNLLIIGSHSKSNIPAFLGSSAQGLVETTPCDVLTIRVPA
jgi:nucleotide-binding universal stress UspA family protein